MLRRFLSRWSRDVNPESTQRGRRPALCVEALEDRILLDAGLPPAIVVGRTLSAYTTADVQDGRLSITYTVYNQQADPLSGVLLTDTLQPGVTFESASVLPDRNGQEMAWSLGTLEAFGRASVQLTVSLAGPTPLQLDSGARAFGTLNAGLVSDDAPAATLRTDVIAPELLASTPDANTTDPVVQEKAAALDYDPQRIFDFLRTEIGYESYVGSLRGARGTLWSGAGNALDEASLGVALMRASGIPARYAEGTLSDPLAQQLILSMFPEPVRVFSCLEPDVPTADPANDPQLLAEARQHLWVQYDAGAGLLDADPTFAAAQPGQSFTTADAVFTEVPDALRHKVALRLTRELTIPGSGLLSGESSQFMATVLDQTFSAVDLVGRSLTVSQVVTSTNLSALFGTVTHRYTPYLVINQRDGNVGDDPIITGTDFQEILTSFPLGNQILTGLFLQLDLLSPEVAGERVTQRLEKTLFDRIGYVARSVGDVAVPLSVNVDAPPALNSADAWSVEVTAAVMPEAPLLTQQAELARVSTAFAALAAVVDDLPETSPQTQEAIRLRDRFALASTSLIGGTFVHESNRVATLSYEQILTVSYFDAPRVVVVNHDFDDTPDLDGDPIRLQIDVLRNQRRNQPRPGQAQEAARLVRFAQGLADSLIEQDVLRDDEPSSVGGFAGALDLFSQALAVPTASLALISRNDLTQLDSLRLPREASARIVQAVSAGKVVLVPTATVRIDGLDRLAWLELDLTTGELISVLDDGTHTGLEEKPDPLIVTLVRRQLAKAAKIADSKANRKVFELVQELKKKNSEKGVVNALQQELNRLKRVEPLGIEEQALINVLDLTLVSYRFTGVKDPPVGRMLLGAETVSEEFASLGTHGEDGVAAAIVHDPLLTVPFGGAQLPTVFKLGFKNLTGVTDTFTFDVSDVPAGFVAGTSVPHITLPPGATGEVSICLHPLAQLPAIGTETSFSVRVTSTNDPGISAVVSQSFAMPAVPGVTWTLDPAELSSSPGAPAQAVLTLVSVGNTPASLTFGVESSPDVTVQGLNPLTLNPGETVIQTLTLTPDPGVALNSIRSLSITPLFGQPEPERFPVVLRVAAPGAEAVARASVAAGQVGNGQLAQRLEDLSLALTNLVQSPTDFTSKNQALANLNSILTLLAVDPILVRFVAPLSAARDVLADAQDAPQIQSAIVALGAVLDDFATSVSALRHHNVTVALSPSSQPAQPGVPQNFGVILRNVGDQTTTYDLALLGLPAGVTGSFNHPSVTLAPGEFSSGVFATLTQTSTEELAAFTFSVQATVAGFPQVVGTATGSLSTRREFVSVAALTLDQPFVDPGTQVNVSARLLNAVNRQQQGRVSFVVRDAAGQAVFTSTPVPVQLSVQTSLLDVNLGTIDTTALTLGQYDVEVIVTDSADNPIPGATRRATLLVGSPLTASLMVGPQNLPPGTATVVNTLQINSAVPLGDPLSLVGFLPIDDPIEDNDFNNDVLNGLALNGNVVYVFGDGGIHVVDVTDLANPQRLTTIRDGGLFFGGRRTGGLVVGDRLFTVDSGTFTSIPGLNNSTVSNSSLGGAFGGSPQLPVQIDSVDANYVFLGDFVVSPDRTHLFASFLNINFTDPAHEIFSQSGTLISFNVSDPTNLTFTPNSILLNENGSQSDPPLLVSGGNVNLIDVEQPDATTLLVASTTSTGANTQDGVGRLLVIDVSDPDNINSDAPNSSKIVNSLDIPGTVLTQGLALDGNLALVVASEGGYRNPFPGTTIPGPTANLVLATVDISDPRNPTLIHTQTLNRAAEGGLTPPANVIQLGNRRFAFASRGAAADTPQLFIVDASDPTNVRIVEQLDVPSPITGLRRDGNFLYTTAADGLTIYRLNVSEIAGTAQVQVPNGTGVAVVPGSFTVEPTQIIPGADFDTLVWDFTFDQTSAAQTMTWQSTVSNLQPGESRPVTLGSTIDFVVQGAPWQIPLPEQNVFAEQIMSLAPATQAARPGQPAAYTLTIANPTQVGVTYDLSVHGIPPEWVAITSQVTVSANSSIDVPLTLTSDPFAPLAEFGFVVTASRSGVAGSVHGSLTLQGDPLLPQTDPEAHGVVVGLTPTQASAGQGTSARFVVRVTNTGSVADTFSFGAADLPPGMGVTLEQTDPNLPAGLVHVPPGVGNFRDVTILLTPAIGTDPGNIPFRVVATSTTRDSVTDTADGTLVVLANGVHVSLNPLAGTPGTTFQLTVTNTGQVTDTFDLSLGGPAALAAILGTSKVTLAPGASQTVSVQTGPMGFAVLGLLSLHAIARSESNPAVQAAASANIPIPARVGMSAAFVPASQVLPSPGPGSFLLQVRNTGNIEDSYEATIIGATGGIIASLAGLDGLPTQKIPLFRLPGLSPGAILLNTSLAGATEGTVTVQVRSLTDGSIVTTSTAKVTVSPRARASLPEQRQSPVVGAGIVTLPGVPGKPVRLEVRYLSSSTLFRNEVGVILLDADGRIGGLKPGDPGFLLRAFARRRVLVRRGDHPGKRRRLVLPGGSQALLYLVPNSTLKAALASNPENRIGGGPVVLWSMNEANPDRKAHVRLGRGKGGALKMRWEDLVRNSDNDFNDLVLSIRSLRG